MPNTTDIPNCDICPIGKRYNYRRCPYSHHKFRYGKRGKLQCDYKGEIKDEPRCGDCAHWQGHLCHQNNNNGRHDFFGNCYYKIGLCNACKPVGDCPHYIERKDGELAHTDWIEQRVGELGGTHDYSPESHELRMQARKEWEDNHIHRPSGI